MSEQDPRMNQIKWRRASNGKYFSTFDTKKEAWECFLEFARRYRHGNYTVKELCEQYQEKGIMLYPTQTGQWLADILNITVKRWGNNRDVNKRTTTLSMDIEVAEIKEQLADNLGSQHFVNHYINQYLRVMMNLPIDEVFSFVKDEYGEKLVAFLEDKGEVRAVYVGKLSEGTRKLIASLCDDAELHGFEYIKRKCTTLGFYTIGANNV